MILALFFVFGFWFSVFVFMESDSSSINLKPYNVMVFTLKYKDKKLNYFKRYKFNVPVYDDDNTHTKIPAQVDINDEEEEEDIAFQYFNRFGSALPP